MAYSMVLYGQYSTLLLYSTLSCSYIYIMYQKQYPTRLLLVVEHEKAYYNSHNMYRLNSIACKILESSLLSMVVTVLGISCQSKIYYPNLQYQCTIQMNYKLQNSAQETATLITLMYPCNNHISSQTYYSQYSTQTSKRNWIEESTESLVYSTKKRYDSKNTIKHTSYIALLT